MATDIDADMRHRGHEEFPMGHPHDHDHSAPAGGEADQPVLDMSIPDSELSPAELSRRGFLRSAGLLGAGTAAAAAGAFAVPEVAMAHDPGPLGPSWAGRSRINNLL